MKTLIDAQLPTTRARAVGVCAAVFENLLFHAYAVALVVHMTVTGGASAGIITQAGVFFAAAWAVVAITWARSQFAPQAALRVLALLAIPLRFLPLFAIPLGAPVVMITLMIAAGTSWAAYSLNTSYVVNPDGQLRWAKLLLVPVLVAASASQVTGGYLARHATRDGGVSPEILLGLATAAAVGMVGYFLASRDASRDRGQGGARVRRATILAVAPAVAPLVVPGLTAEALLNLSVPIVTDAVGSHAAWLPGLASGLGALASLWLRVERPRLLALSMMGTLVGWLVFVVGHGLLVAAFVIAGARLVSITASAASNARTIAMVPGQERAGALQLLIASRVALAPVLAAGLAVPIVAGVAAVGLGVTTRTSFARA